MESLLPKMVDFKAFLLALTEDSTLVGAQSVFLVHLSRCVLTQGRGTQSTNLIVAEPLCVD